MTVWLRFYGREEARRRQERQSEARRPPLQAVWNHHGWAMFLVVVSSHADVPNPNFFVTNRGFVALIYHRHGEQPRSARMAYILMVIKREEVGQAQQAERPTDGTIGRMGSKAFHPKEQSPRSRARRSCVDRLMELAS